MSAAPRTPLFVTLLFTQGKNKFNQNDVEFDFKIDRVLAILSFLCIINEICKAVTSQLSPEYTERRTIYFGHRLIIPKPFVRID